MSKPRKDGAPKEGPDNHAKIPEPTITANKLSYEPNFNEKYFSEELGLNNQTLQVNSDSENRYSEEKKLKKTLETVGLHLVETRKKDIGNGEQKEQKLGRKIKRNESDKQRDDSEPLTMVETKK